MGMLVKAIRKGYYGEKRRTEGDVFALIKDEDFSDKWMEETDSSIEAGTRNHIARVQQAPDARDVNHALAVTAEDPEIAGRYDQNAPGVGGQAGKHKRNARPQHHAHAKKDEGTEKSDSDSK